MYIYTHCLDIYKLFTELKQRRTAKQQKTWMTGILSYNVFHLLRFGYPKDVLCQERIMFL